MSRCSMESTIYHAQQPIRFTANVCSLLKHSPHRRTESHVSFIQVQRAVADSDLVKLSIKVGNDGSTNVEVFDGESHLSRPVANEVHCRRVITACHCLFSALTGALAGARISSI
jgi:hypothetical protein